MKNKMILKNPPNYKKCKSTDLEQTCIKGIIYMI